MFKTLGLLLCFLFASSAYAAEKGYIYDFKGPVLINGKLANKNSPITFGDEIITGSRGRIGLRLAGNVYRVGNRSHLKLPETSKNFTLNFFFGSILAVFRSDTPKTIQTLTSVLGVRGTGLYLDIDSEQTFLCTCYGDVDFKDKENEGNVRHIHSEYHNIVALNHQTRAFSKQAMKGHATPDLFELEALAERTPPSTFTIEHEKNNQVSGG